MSAMTKFTLMFVVFVGLIGQGLVFPIINALIMEPASGFIPAGTSAQTRHLYYGLVIGTFFLAWFLGVVYVSKVSDAIGRKNAVTTAVFCLAGGIVSLIGGGLMDINIRLPFYIAAGAALLGLAAMALTWGSPEMRRITSRQVTATSS